MTLTFHLLGAVTLYFHVLSLKLMPCYNPTNSLMLITIYQTLVISNVNITLIFDFVTKKFTDSTEETENTINVAIPDLNVLKLSKSELFSL